MQKLVRTAGVLIATVSGIGAAQLPTPSGGARTSAQLSLEHTADSLYAAHAYRRALELFEQLTHSDSTVLRYWNQLGMSAAQVHEYAVGARAFARAATLRGGPAAAYNAGAMHARLGHPDSAFFWLQRAVQTGFTDTATLNSDEDLTEIRSDSRFSKVLYAATHAPAPCQADTLYRRFDFWIGNWKVSTPGGTQQVGTSHVDVVSGGCALLENWRDMRGAEGKSLNTYDPTLHQWRQFWVGQQGMTDYSRSEWRDGNTLSFYSVLPPTPARGRAIMRLSFTPLEHDLVRQHGELSTDDGKTWTTQYDFRYHRIP